MYDTNYCIFNELTGIDQQNQLLIITNTMNIIIILQPSNFNVFLHGHSFQCENNIFFENVFRFYSLKQFWHCLRQDIYVDSMAHSIIYYDYIALYLRYNIILKKCISRPT